MPKPKKVWVFHWMVAALYVDHCRILRRGECVEHTDDPYNTEELVSGCMYDYYKRAGVVPIQGVVSCPDMPGYRFDQIQGRLC